MWILKLLFAIVMAVFVGGVYATNYPHSANAVFYRTEAGNNFTNGFVLMIVVAVTMCYFLFRSTKGRR